MPNTLPPRVRLAGYEFSLKTGELSGGGQIVRLGEKPFRVLLILVEGGGELVTREEIQNKLWPGDTVVDFEHGINTAIKVLRRALGDSAEDPKYIETIPRRGYRLMVPVERLDSTVGDTSGTGLVSSSDGGTGVQLQLEPSGLTGRTVSHYRVLEVVGGGGMGVVYRAEDLKLGRAVALKFLPEEVGNDPQALERFEREARAASSLDHPNICPIYEFGEHEGRPFIVMQLLQGQTLRDYLASGALKDAASGAQVSLDRVLDIAIQIADGLEAAHEQGIVHRDIKPANIFITTKGVAKILDFGLAKLPLQPSAEQVIPAELRHRKPWTLAARLGPLARQPTCRRNKRAGSGRRAFTGDNAAALHDAILNRAPTPSSVLNPELSADLQDVIQKCCRRTATFVTRRPPRSAPTWRRSSVIESILCSGGGSCWRQRQSWSQL
jgi:DNA-binding winged helix-turn-helix (wHTH) protein